MTTSPSKQIQSPYSRATVQTQAQINATNRAWYNARRRVWRAFRELATKRWRHD